MSGHKKLEITVQPLPGGYQIQAIVFCSEDVAGTDVARAPIQIGRAVCSTYNQIPTRIRSLVDVAREHMQPKAEGQAKT